MPLDPHDYYENIFKKIFEMSSDGFVVTDTEGIVTAINDNYAKFFGVKKKDIIGKSILNIIPNSKMIDIVKNKFSEEDVVHTYNSGIAKGKSVIVSRSYVENDAGKIIAGVAQVKFRLQSLEIAHKLMNEYEELEFYREEHRTQNFENIVGSSHIFLSKLEECLKIAKTDFSVLITGETGTGKEIFAKALHNNSVRRNKPLVSVNCAAIPSELLESEFFGYTEGAFTGAKKSGKKGKFLVANGGTIFLDEIGDMPISMQVKLLRVLQEHEIEPVGSETTIPLDVRVIAATRQDLEEKIQNGSFREDLYYRLNVVNINIPPLRERGCDSLELAHHFLNKLNEKYKTFKELSKEVEECFCRYQWPGNVREVDNVIKSAYAVSDSAVIGLEDLPSKMYQKNGSGIRKTLYRLEEIMDDYEKLVLTDILRRNHWNCNAAANEAGIHRSVLYRKIKRYHIEKEI